MHKLLNFVSFPVLLLGLIVLSNGILGYNTEPLVSIDFNHSPLSSTFDATQTRVMGNLVKVVSWYDNEWGFSNRMLDTALAMTQVCQVAELTS